MGIEAPKRKEKEARDSAPAPCRAQGWRHRETLGGRNRAETRLDQHVGVALAGIRLVSAHARRLAPSVRCGELHNPGGTSNAMVPVPVEPKVCAPLPPPGAAPTCAPATDPAAGTGQ